MKALLALGTLLALLGVYLGVTRSYHDVVWEGGTDIDMLHQVQKDIATAQSRHQRLRAQLISPGGPVVAALEIARVVRNASDAGLVIEIHGTAVVASGGTFVLAAGTPGHRFLSRTTLFLVHPIQRGSMFSAASCVERPAPPKRRDDVAKLKTEDDKVIDNLYELMEAHYVRFTGRSSADVARWVECGNETVGVRNAVAMGIADHLED